MAKKMVVQLAFGAVAFAAGFLMIFIPGIPGIVPALIGSISGGWIAVVIATKGGTIIMDEMVMRIRHTSGYYTFNATLYFIFVLAGLNWFSRLTLSISELLLAMMIFMSVTFIVIRYFLMARGKA